MDLKSFALRRLARKRGFHEVIPGMLRKFDGCPTPMVGNLRFTTLTILASDVVVGDSHTKGVGMFIVLLKVFRTKY